MKAMSRIAVLSLSLLGLAACTSAGTRSAYVAPATVEQATTTNEMRTVSDSKYMAEVERIARRRGVQVQWVNPPVKRVYATR